VAGFDDRGLLNTESFHFSYSPRATGCGARPVNAPAVPDRQTDAGREDRITDGSF
jgi:hypothetical protein